jgi:4-hydroxythreonine-4-phosphate dehydrogenase
MTSSGAPASCSRIVISMGDPAGIGPEALLRACDALAEDASIRTLVVGDPRHLEALASRLDLRAPKEMVACGTVEADLEPGRPRPSDARIALDAITKAADMTLRGDTGALVTAPVSKQAIAEIEPRFRGHTEFLAASAGVRHPLMLFAGIRPAVALLTTHLPLASAVAAVRRPRIVATLERLDEEWARWFGARPRIAVAGLNPHAGEYGLLGSEDDVEVRPAVVEARRNNVDARGPYPADSIFRSKNVDVILALYHDQGTIMAKNAPAPSVNTTLGLPYPRTSPDHGVAYDIAAQHQADPAAMIAAIRLAAEMAQRR